VVLAKEATHLRVNMSATVVPLNGQATVEAVLTNGSGAPLANQKVVFAYDEGWNWAEDVQTDGNGRASYVLRTDNNTDNTGFCGRRGSQNVPARYQMQVYFQGTPSYEASVVRVDFNVVNAGEAASSPIEKTEESTAGFNNVPPVIYYGWDYSNKNPNQSNYGPFGGIYYQTWNMMSYDQLDNYLNNAKAMKITLADGRQISKPILHGFYFYDSTGDLSSQAAKTAAKGSYILDPPDTGGKVCPALSTPKYCNADWQNAFRDEIYKLGRQFDGKVAGELISIGFEGEATDAKNINGCDYKKELHETMGCSEATFLGLIDKAMGWYREAFPNTPLYMQGLPFNVPKALSFNPPIGYKTNNWEPGWGIWAYSNISDMYGESRVWYNYPRVPRALESKYGASMTNGSADVQKGNYWGTYWMILGMLAHKPDLIDFHADQWEAFVKIPWLSEFVGAQLQKTPADSPMVWTAMRDTHDIMKKEDSYNNCQMSGVYGDYSFYIYRKEEVSGGRTVALKQNDLPTETRDQIYTNKSNGSSSKPGVVSQIYTARRTDAASGNNYMYFDIDNGWKYAGLRPDGQRRYKIILTYLDKGSDTLGLEYSDENNQIKKINIQKNGSNLWIRKEILIGDAYFNDQLTGRTDIRINNNGDGDETIHMIQVWGEGAVGPGPDVPDPTSIPGGPTPATGFPGNLQYSCSSATQARLSFTKASGATSYVVGTCPQPGCSADKYINHNITDLGTDNALSIEIGVTSGQWYGWWVIAKPGTKQTTASNWFKCDDSGGSPTPTPPAFSCSGLSLNGQTENISVNVGATVNLTSTVSNYGLISSAKVLGIGGRVVDGQNIVRYPYGEGNLFGTFTATEPGVYVFETNAYESSNCNYLCSAGKILYRNNAPENGCLNPSGWSNMGACTSNGCMRYVTVVEAPKCTKKNVGDANCDGEINMDDFEIWKKEFLGESNQTSADFDGDGKVSIVDFGIWKVGFLNNE